MPDAEAHVILPWEPSVALFPSDLWCEGKPFEPCSRNILNRQVAKAEDMGFTMNLGMEAEFFVFRDAGEDRVRKRAGTRYRCWSIWRSQPMTRHGFWTTSTGWVNWFRR